MTELTSQQFLDAADKLQNGLAIYKADFTLLYANATARDHFPVMYENLDKGMKLDDAIRAEIVSIYPDMETDGQEQMVEACLQAIRASSSLDMAASGGRSVKAYHSSTAAGDVIGISVDLTELRQRERDLKKASAAAEAASQAKSEFLASMSHEIRTPLNGILGMAQALQTRGLQGDEREMLDTILESSKSLMTILNDILDLSKIEAGKLELSPVRVDLRHRLSRLQKFFAP
ncbi:MAG: histidine kinase dimerization/phospho-acceptor domain-containing protein, partial [Pseudomonadota bacterium]